MTFVRRFVYTPHTDGTQAHRLGLVLFFDGSQFIDSMGTTTLLDNLIADKLIPPVVAAFFDSPDRNSEYPPNEKFQRFISSELVPLLRSRFQLSDNPRESVVAGTSYGGLAATYTGFRHPDIFGNVIAQSASFWWFP